MLSEVDLSIERRFVLPSGPPPLKLDHYRGTEKHGLGF